MFIKSSIEVNSNIKHINDNKQISLLLAHSIIFLKHKLNSYNKKPRHCHKNYKYIPYNPT